MSSLLLPNEYVTSIYHIDLQRLWDDGMRALVTDLDNTLVAWGVPDAPKRLVSWLRHAQSLGFAVCLLSNNHELRVATFARPLGIPAIANARKPRHSAYDKALALVGSDVHSTVMIGDQLFTDILGGNRMGLYTVLVVPVPGREHGGTRLIRFVERRVLKGRQPLTQEPYFPE